MDLTTEDGDSLTHPGQPVSLSLADVSLLRLAVVGDFITYEPYGIMFRKDDPQMADAVSRAFAVMGLNVLWP